MHGWACAVSGTGKGEFFIRYVVGHEVASRVAYLGQDLETAAGNLVHKDLAPYDIGAGLVAIDAEGGITAPYNTPGMFRGWVTPRVMLAWPPMTPCIRWNCRQLPRAR